MAKNACDHPHGGGEGRKSQPSSPRSPWGWLTSGTATNKKKYQILKTNPHITARVLIKNNLIFYEESDLLCNKSASRW